MFTLLDNLKSLFNLIFRIKKVDKSSNSNLNKTGSLNNVNMNSGGNQHVGNIYNINSEPFDNAKNKSNSGIDMDERIGYYFEPESGKHPKDQRLDVEKVKDLERYVILLPKFYEISKIDTDLIKEFKEELYASKSPYGIYHITYIYWMENLKRRFEHLVYPAEPGKLEFSQPIKILVPKNK